MKNRRPPPVRDLEDAVTWLSFFSRFSEGDLAANAGGTLDVLLRIDAENEELKQRCTALARHAEMLEARQGEGL